MVEIVKSKIGKRKSNVGRLVEESFWWKFFLVPVDSDDAEILLTIIKDQINEGTNIIRDCWRAYTCPQSLN